GPADGLTSASQLGSAIPHDGHPAIRAGGGPHAREPRQISDAPRLNLLDIMELTSVNGRDAPVDPIVEAANVAFARIEGHRKLFRRDWLPFLDGVYLLSLRAWERAGQPTRLDGRPDWTDDRVPIEFRRLTADLPWGRFFDRRRTLLSALRQIGGDRDDFLKWYDGRSEEARERTGYPETLWRKFKSEKKKPDPDTDDDHNNEKKKPDPSTDDDPNKEQGATNGNTTNDSATEPASAGGAAGIRTDDERM